MLESYLVHVFTILLHHVASNYVTSNKFRLNLRKNETPFY